MLLSGLGRGRIEKPRPVQVTGQSLAPGQLRGLLQIRKRQQLASQRVFQRQQPGAGKVGVIRLDGRLDILQRQGSVRLVRQRLRLNVRRS